MCLSFVGVSAVTECEYVGNFADAIINCNVVKLTNALGYASRCVCLSQLKLGLLD